jgi:hypothetical protein
MHEVGRQVGQRAIRAPHSYSPTLEVADLLLGASQLG